MTKIQRQHAAAYRRLDRAEKALTAAQWELRNATADVIYLGRLRIGEIKARRK